MTKFMLVSLLTLSALLAGCNMGQPVNYSLAEDAHDQINVISDDNEMLIEFCDRALAGDLDWAKENGEDVWTDEKASMKLTTGQARITAAELLANAKEKNPE